MLDVTVGTGASPARSLGDDQHAQTRGTSPGSGVACQDVEVRRCRVTPERCHGVHQQWYAVCEAQPVRLLDGLTGADLGIGGLDRREHSAGNGDRLLEGREVHPTKPVHAHLGEQQRVVCLGGVVPTRRQDCRVLDGCGDHSRATTAAGIPQSLQTGT